MDLCPQEIDVSEAVRVVAINVIYVREGYQDEALVVLRDVAERVSSRHAGMVRTRVYRSLDGKTVATQIEWSSKAQLDAVFRDQEFVRRFNRLREIGIWESHEYEMTDDIRASGQVVDRMERAHR